MLAPRATGAPEPEEMKNDANQNRRPGAASGLQSLLLAVRSSNQPEPNRPEPNLLKLKKRKARSVIPFPPICHFSIQHLAFSLAAVGNHFCTILHLFPHFHFPVPLSINHLRSGIAPLGFIILPPMILPSCLRSPSNSASHSSALSVSSISTHT